MFLHFDRVAHINITLRLTKGFPSVYWATAKRAALHMSSLETERFNYRTTLVLEAQCPILALLLDFFSIYARVFHANNHIRFGLSVSLIKKMHEYECVDKNIKLAKDANSWVILRNIVEVDKTAIELMS